MAIFKYRMLASYFYFVTKYILGCIMRAMKLSRDIKGLLQSNWNNLMLGVASKT